MFLIVIAVLLKNEEQERFSAYVLQARGETFSRTVLKQEFCNKHLSFYIMLCKLEQTTSAMPCLWCYKVLLNQAKSTVKANLNQNVDGGKLTKLLGTRNLQLGNRSSHIMWLEIHLSEFNFIELLDHLRENNVGSSGARIAS